MTAVRAGLAMTADELAAIEGRLTVSGLFVSHAHTDVIRLLGEVHRLRQALARVDVRPPVGGGPR